MATVELMATGRVTKGKGGARKVRAAGNVPGIVYGSAEGPVAIAIERARFDQLLRRVSSGNVIIDLKVSGLGAQDMKALIKEVQRDPISSRVLHVDLQHIDMDHVVRVRVPIVLEGIAPGIKAGGLLEHGLRELEIECLPADIPNEITVSIDALGKNESIHVRDLEMTGMNFLDANDAVVVAIVSKGAEEVVAVAEVAEVAAAPKGAPAGKGVAPGKGAPSAAPAKGAAAPAKGAAPAKAAAPAKKDKKK